MINKLAKRPRSRKIDERFGLPAKDVRIKAVILSLGRPVLCAWSVDRQNSADKLRENRGSHCLRFGAFGSRRWRKSAAIIPLRAAKIHFRKFRERSRNIFAINEKFSHFATMRGDSGSPAQNGYKKRLLCKCYDIWWTCQWNIVNQTHKTALNVFQFS